MQYHNDNGASVGTWLRFFGAIFLAWYFATFCEVGLEGESIEVGVLPPWNSGGRDRGAKCPAAETSERQQAKSFPDFHASPHQPRPLSKNVAKYSAKKKISNNKRSYSSDGNTIIPTIFRFYAKQPLLAELCFKVPLQMIFSLSLKYTMNEIKTIVVSPAVYILIQK